MHDNRCELILRTLSPSPPPPPPPPLQGTNPVSESQMSMDDFTVLKVIGRGSYAKVLMVSLPSPSFLLEYCDASSFNW